MIEQLVNLVLDVRRSLASHPLSEHELRSFIDAVTDRQWVLVDQVVSRVLVEQAQFTLHMSLQQTPQGPRERVAAMLLQEALCAEPRPISMLLTCVACGTRHIDRGEWATRPHREHLCENCGAVWVPAALGKLQLTTVGVAKLESEAPA